MSAFKLNGQVAQCLEFDVELQRYVVLLKSGESKKIKPQNIKPLGKLRSEMPNVLQIKALIEPRNRKAFRSELISVLKKWECVLPNVVSSRVLVDWAKLESPDLRKRLLESKTVPLDTLPDDVSIVFLSVPRETINLEEESTDLIKKAVAELGHTLEKQILKSQVYWILPFNIVDGFELPIIKRAFYCSYPLWTFLIDLMVLCIEPKDDPMSLHSAAQRLDVICAAKAGTRVYAYGDSAGGLKVKQSLPSRGHGRHDDVKIYREIEKNLNIQRPADGDQSFFIQCHSF